MVRMSSGLRDLQIAGRLVHKRGLPVSLIFFVTGRCNLLCTHCFYWEQLNKKKNELTPDEIDRVTRSLPNLLSVSLTGGEPYLRPDLAEIAHLFERNSGVRNIQIPSNGFSIEKTVSGAEAVLKRVKTARVATGVSLDGPPEIHNAIRQNPRSFSHAIEALDGLKKLKPRFPNLSVGVALTVSAANQDQLSEFYRYVEEELQPDAVTITLVRGNPLDPTLKNVDMQVYREFARKVVIYRKDHLRTRRWSDRLVVAKEAADLPADRRSGRRRPENLALLRRPVDRSSKRNGRRLSVRDPGPQNGECSGLRLRPCGALVIQ